MRSIVLKQDNGAEDDVKKPSESVTEDLCLKVKHLAQSQDSLGIHTTSITRKTWFVQVGV